MKITRKQFVEDVRQEIEHLRKNLTEEEKSKLDPEKLDHEDKGYCIYGMSTGSCFSERAKDLMPKKYQDLPHGFEDKYKYSDLIFEAGSYFTDLEQYLFIIPQKKRVEILLYIKGENDVLNIK